MSLTDFNRYQKLANRSLYGNEQILTNCALGLASESGEVLELIQKYTFNNETMTKEQLTKELGDVLWYVSQIAQWANIPFEEVAESNIAMLEARYPDKYISQEL